MPNHCYNTTEFRGPKEEIDQIIHIIQGGDRRPELHEQETDTEKFGLKNLVPMPADLATTVSGSTSLPDWYMTALASGEITQEEFDKAEATMKERRDKYAANQEKYGYTNWYDWACAEENWGTKWGDYDHFCDSGDEAIEITGGWYISYSYNTAWGPFSDTFWTKVSLMFPNTIISTSYEESGMCFMGAIAVKNGEIVTTYQENFFPDFPDSDGENFDELYCEYLEKVTERREGLSDMVFEQLIDQLNTRKAGI